MALSDFARTFILATVPAMVGGGVIVGGIEYFSKNRELDIQLIEIGLSILRADPAEEQISPAREWAITLVEKHSGEGFGEDRERLKNHPVQRVTSDTVRQARREGKQEGKIEERYYVFARHFENNHSIHGINQDRERLPVLVEFVTDDAPWIEEYPQRSGSSNSAVNASGVELWATNVLGPNTDGEVWVKVLFETQNLLPQFPKNKELLESKIQEASGWVQLKYIDVVAIRREVQ
ncbi:hypothetical protein [Roseibium album]|uniref:hypothetical protein n=1 Tax=Roseibium album TaxID=311410 RepID=UPI00248FA241|nr:hypothetical protein [Roseibium album]